jgi:hypothetical protein
MLIPVIAVKGKMVLDQLNARIASPTQRHIFPSAKAE